MYTYMCACAVVAMRTLLVFVREYFCQFHVTEIQLKLAYSNKGNELAHATGMSKEWAALEHCSIWGSVVSSEINLCLTCFASVCFRCLYSQMALSVRRQNGCSKP